MITEFDLRAIEVTLKRKKAGLLPLREKSDLFPQTNVTILLIGKKVKFDITLNPCYKGIITDGRWCVKGWYYSWLFDFQKFDKFKRNCYIKKIH